MSFLASAKTNEVSSKTQNFLKMGRRDKDKKSPLVALLPGAKIDNTKGKISVNIGISKETVIFNVGGVRFETFKSTLYKQPNSPLANDVFLRKYYREEKGDYFFDRDPDIFKAILNYLRTGELHMPPFVCGPVAKTELEFWGVPDTIIERCCYSHYNSYNATLEALNRLENDRHGSFDFPLEGEGGGSRRLSKWTRMRNTVSLILNHPEVSKTAKAYGIISLMVVAVSIISFLADTHPTMRTIETVSDVTSIYNSTTNATTKFETYRQIQVQHPVLGVIDICCLAFFTIEYGLRLLLARKRCRFALSVLGVIDLCALLPDYVQLILLAVNSSLANNAVTKIIAVLKITRILRIFRLVRHVPGLWILIYTLKASLRELLLMVAFLFVGMLIFSSLIFYADDQKVFTSIPHSFWWALITMTTVGYGDMYPVTSLGYVVGSLTAMSGLLTIGFSVPILVNNFMMYYQHMQFAINDERRDIREMSNRRNKKEKEIKNNNTQNVM